MSFHHRLPILPSEADLLDPKWVTRHSGDLAGFLRRHRRQAACIVKKGRSAQEAIAPSLLYRISHEKTLRIAWDYLKEYGGQAPGPDGLRYDDPTEPQLWQLLRSVRDEIRRGEYVPGEERICKIPKGPGRGERPLLIQSIIDRVIQRAAMEVIQPLVDPQFDERSFGFRPKRSALQALALAEQISYEHHRRIWITADVRDAFQRVPLSRLLDIVRKYLIADNLVEFIGAVTSGASKPGLRQGGCLSPLLLNLYLHHCLDRRWRKQNPGIPLLRYADDILVLCRSESEAKQAFRELRDLLRSSGMELKQSREEAVRTLTPDEPAIWMGFHIERGKNELRLRLAKDAWWKMNENLALAHEQPNSPVRAFQAIIGWVGQKGPCYPFLDHETTYAHIKAVAAAHSFDEIPDGGDIKRHWQRAYARWKKLRAGIAPEV